MAVLLKVLELERDVRVFLHIGAYNAEYVATLGLRVWAWGCCLVIAISVIASEFFGRYTCESGYILPHEGLDHIAKAAPVCCLWCIAGRMSGNVVNLQWRRLIEQNVVARALLLYGL